VRKKNDPSGVVQACLEQLPHFSIEVDEISAPSKKDGAIFEAWQSVSNFEIHARLGHGRGCGRGDEPITCIPWVRYKENFFCPELRKKQLHISSHRCDRVRVLASCMRIVGVKHKTSLNRSG